MALQTANSFNCPLNRQKNQQLEAGDWKYQVSSWCNDDLDLWGHLVEFLQVGT